MNRSAENYYSRIPVPELLKRVPEHVDPNELHEMIRNGRSVSISDYVRLITCLEASSPLDIHGIFVSSYRELSEHAEHFGKDRILKMSEESVQCHVRDYLSWTNDRSFRISAYLRRGSNGKTEGAKAQSERAITEIERRIRHLRLQLLTASVQERRPPEYQTRTLMARVRGFFEQAFRNPETNS